MEQDVQNELAELIKILPKRIRERADIKVISAAIEDRLIDITEDGQLVWLLKSKTLLAYFCGRMWCGDSARYQSCCHTWVWERNGVVFPEKALNNLFGEKSLRTLRKNRDLCVLPKGWERVEKIFSESAYGLLGNAV